MNRRLAGETLKTATMLGLRVATQAASLLLLVHLLGPRMYGSYVALAALAVVLGVPTSLGAGFIMMTRAHQGNDAVADVWTYAWPLTLASGLALLLLYLPIAAYVGGSDGVPFKILLFLGLTEIVIGPLIPLLSQALQAVDKVVLSQFLQWIPMGIRALSILPCFIAPLAHRLETYAVAQFLATFLSLTLCVFVSKRHLALTREPRYPSRSELWTGSGYAVKHLIAVNSSEMDKMASVRMLGNHDAGIYAAGARILSAVVTPMIALLLTSQPKLFGHAYQPTQEGARLIRWLTLLAAVWGLFAWLLLSLISPVLPLIFGHEFDPLAKIMPWIALVAIPLTYRLVASTVLLTLGRPAGLVFFEVFGVAVLGTAIAVLTPQWGIRGLAGALFVGESCMALGGWTLIHFHQKRPLERPSSH